jgi:hypothetical protein
MTSATRKPEPVSNKEGPESMEPAYSLNFVDDVDRRRLCRISASLKVYSAIVLAPATGPLQDDEYNNEKRRREHRTREHNFRSSVSTSTVEVSKVSTVLVGVHKES